MTSDVCILDTSVRNTLMNEYLNTCSFFTGIQTPSKKLSSSNKTPEYKDDNTNKLGTSPR